MLDCWHACQIRLSITVSQATCCRNEAKRLPSTVGGDKDVLFTTHSNQLFQNVLRHQPKPVSDQPFQCGIGAPSSPLLKHQVAIITQPVARGSVKQSRMAANSLERKVVFTRMNTTNQGRSPRQKHGLGSQNYTERRQICDSPL